MNYDWPKELREMKFVSRSIRFVVYRSRLEKKLVILFSFENLNKNNHVWTW